MKDTDGRLMDDPKAKDHHCCKGLTINSTHIFEDINVSDPPLGDMFIINSESKEQAITGPWKDAGLKGDFIVVDSWTYDPNTPPGGPSTERRCFCLNNTTVFMNLGMYLFDNYVWIHEWGHLQGLNDLYDKPDQADYPNNFMNTWKGTYVGYTDYDAWQCDHL